MYVVYPRIPPKTPLDIADVLQLLTWPIRAATSASCNHGPLICCLRQNLVSVGNDDLHEYCYFINPAGDWPKKNLLSTAQNWDYGPEAKRTYAKTDRCDLGSG